MIHVLAEVERNIRNAAAENSYENVVVTTEKYLDKNIELLTKREMKKLAQDRFQTLNDASF